MSKDDIVIGAGFRQLTSCFSIGLQYGGSGPFTDLAIDHLFFYLSQVPVPQLQGNGALISKLKQSRRVATRYDESASRSALSVAFVALAIWTK
jgi:hypothetical protein